MLRYREKTRRQLAGKVHVILVRQSAKRKLYVAMARAQLSGYGGEPVGQGINQSRSERPKPERPN